VACEIGSRFNFVALLARVLFECLLELFWAGLTFDDLAVLGRFSPRCDRPAKLAGCVSFRSDPAC